MSVFLFWNRGLYLGMIECKKVIWQVAKYNWDTSWLQCTLYSRTLAEDHLLKTVTLSETSSSAMAERPREAWYVSINVQRYTRNHAQNCIFGPSCVRIRSNISVLFERFNAKKLCSRVFFERMPVLLVKQRISVSEPPFGAGLRVNEWDIPLARWKARSRLSIDYNWTFIASSYGWGTSTSKSAFVEGVGHFGAKY